jgi:two-component system chemotaxis response regulator CheY
VKILIVDDSKAMRSIVLRTFRQAGLEGHTFVEASNGKEALDVIRSSSPDLVLADWNMPEMNGITLLETLRAEGNATRLGFITSESAAETKDHALKSGALFLLTKPFTVDTFKAVVAGHLA